MQTDLVATLLASLISQGLVAEQSQRRTRNSQRISFPDWLNTVKYLDSLVDLFDSSKLVGQHVSLVTVIVKIVILTL
jgi:hypothetical protein